MADDDDDDKDTAAGTLPTDPYRPTPDAEVDSPRVTTGGSRGGVRSHVIHHASRSMEGVREELASIRFPDRPGAPPADSWKRLWPPPGYQLPSTLVSAMVERIGFEPEKAESTVAEWILEGQFNVLGRTLHNPSPQAISREFLQNPAYTVDLTADYFFRRGDDYLPRKVLMAIPDHEIQEAFSAAQMQAQGITLPVEHQELAEEEEASFAAMPPFPLMGPDPVITPLLPVLERIANALERIHPPEPQPQPQEEEE